jgi:iron complex outermembrane recepter protein
VTTSKCFWIRATALGSTIALGVTLTAPSVRAQELQEIVVTAQKRSENVQDVPIAVTAISPTQIEAANIDSLMQLQLLTPDLTFSQNALYARNYIRGVGSYVANPGLEPSVATYIDDVYTYRQIGAVYGTLDQQDVEVLKGPQGALYGKNATGGAILMYSANPTNKDEGMLEAEYGRFNRQEYEGMINIPVSDTFKIRVAARWLGEDGYIANSLGNETGGQRGTTARIKLDWTPNDVVDFLLSSEWSNSFYNFNIHQERLPAPLCVACLIYGLTPPPANSYSTSEDILPSTQVQYGFETLKSTVDLSWAKLVSITAYRQEKWDGGYDIDMTTAPFEHFEATEQADTTSQSFRLTSDTKGIFDYLVGVDWDRDNARFYSNIFGDAFAPLPGIQNLSHVISTSTAVYGEGYYRFATGWQLTVGARYNRDSKQFYGYDNPDAQVAEGNVPARFSEAADFTDVTPRVVLAYQHGGAHYYISYNQGFKSGGLNTPAFTTPNKVNPEKLNSVEAGVKIDWLDGRLRTNFDVFHYNYNDLQVSITDIANGGLLTQNAASARIYGVEFDSTLAVTQSLTLGLGAESRRLSPG